ncbi:MAG: hypothetical protein ACLQME_17925 [Alphaproteobacteria bacterium]
MILVPSSTGVTKAMALQDSPCIAAGRRLLIAGLYTKKGNIMPTVDKLHTNLASCLWRNGNEGQRSKYRPARSDDMAIGAGTIEVRKMIIAAELLRS